MDGAERGGSGHGAAPRGGALADAGVARAGGAQMADPAAAAHVGTDRAGLTARLAGQALRLRHEGLPADVQTVARDCLTDWLGCALAGSLEPASRIVAAGVLEEGGRPQSTLIGAAGLDAAGSGTAGPGLASTGAAGPGAAARVSMAQAAWANGTASHALDYDDVNLALPGHPGVALIPGLLALAEHRGARGGLPGRLRRRL